MYIPKIILLGSGVSRNHNLSMVTCHRASHYKGMGEFLMESIISNIRNRFGLVVLLATIVMIAAAGSGASASDDPSSPKFVPWFEIGGFYNSGDDSRGEGIIFAPLVYGERDMVFTDLRMKFFENEAREYNIALGYRHMGSYGFNLGAWIGGDFRKSEIDNRFSQLSGGFEALSHNWDFRLNWYGPGTDSKAGRAGFTQLQLTTNNLYMIGGEEVMLQGIDGELGMRLPVEMVNIDPNKFELRAYGGVFYFDDKDALEEVAGIKARVTLAMNDIIPQLPGSRLTAEYEFSYDDVREERHEIGGRLRIPLSDPGTTTLHALAEMTPQERRMLEGLERDTDIISVQSKRENVEDALTNTDFDRVVYVNDGGSIEDKSAASGDNSLLIVRGVIDDGRQRIEGNQTVQGGGSTIQVRGLKSGTVAGFTAPGSRPTVTNGGANILRLAGNNIHIAGLLLDGQGTNNNGIRGGSNKGNIVIAQNIIQNTGDDAIDFRNRNNNIRILNNAISNAGDEGIDFDNRNTNVTITGNTISNSVDAGIDFDDRNTGVVIADTTITNSGDDGIDLGDRNIVSISGLTINGAGDDGIDLGGRNTVTVAASTITNTDYGIYLSDNQNNVMVSNTVFSNISNDAVLFDGRNNEFLVVDSTITDVFDGIHVDGRSNKIAVTNVAFSNIGDNAIVTHSRNNVLLVSGSTFTNVGDDVLDLNRNTTLLFSGNSVSGNVGQDIFDFQGPNSIVLPSSTGNVNNATLGGDICEGNGNFTGTLEISDIVGIVIVDGGAPCS